VVQPASLNAAIEISRVEDEGKCFTAATVKERIKMITKDGKDGEENSSQGGKENRACEVNGSKDSEGCEENDSRNMGQMKESFTNEKKYHRLLITDIDYCLEMCYYIN
jgi:hypothetical protein